MGLLLCTLNYLLVRRRLMAAPYADIKSPDDVLALGIDKYNEECRSIVMRCATIMLKVLG